MIWNVNVADPNTLSDVVAIKKMGCDPPVGIVPLFNIAMV
jgi:hypothetical protein